MPHFPLNLGARAHTTMLGAVITALLLALFASPAGARTDTFALTKPYNNATVKKKARVQVFLSKALKRRAWGVEFWVDGERVGIDRKAPFNRLIDTRKLDNGQHVFRVSLLVKAKSGRSPDRKVCEFLRSIYVNVKNKNARKTSATTKVALPTPISGTKQKWTMKFRDEFDGAALDPTKWNDQRKDWIEGGSPYNDREGAWYGTGNNTVSGGSLVQTVKDEIAGDLKYNDHLFNKTTGAINTNQKYAFQYGYVEARVKVPSCAGCWPVFWTLPTTNTWPPEIDIFEFLDSAGNERRPFIASHWKNASGLQTALYYYTTPCGTSTDYTNNFHTYGFLWSPKRVQPFLDGVPGPVLTGEAVPHVPMYLIMALSTIDSFNTPAGSQMLTDYVRVWQSNKP